MNQLPRLEVLRLESGRLPGDEQVQQIAGQLPEYLGRFEDMYPNILTWANTKLLEGSETGSHTSWIVRDGNGICAMMAAKKRPGSTKICHLSVMPEYRHYHLGELLFVIAATASEHSSNRFYFTLPESLWEEEKGFFQSFGFDQAEQASKQYRLFDKELYTSAIAKKVLDHARPKIEKLLPVIWETTKRKCPTLLISIKPKYARKIFDGGKTIEIRRKFSAAWKGETVAIYSSSPDRAIVGEVLIDDVIYADVNTIWEKFENNIGVSLTELTNYARGDRVYALVLGNAKRYNKQIRLEDHCLANGQRVRPPQSYARIRPDGYWPHIAIISQFANGAPAIAPSPLILKG